MSSVLKKITAEAKRIRKANPRVTWKGAIKQAGAKYRATAKKKASRPVAKKAAKKKTTVRRVSGFNSAFGGAMVAGISESSALSILKRKYLDGIGVLESRKYAAKTKVEKRSLQKKITELKAKYRKLV